MSEIDAFIRVTQAIKLDEKYHNCITQIDDFERFLKEMNLSIEKKRILISREDEIPHAVYLNV